FGSDPGSGLGGALERAGNDDVHLGFNCGESAAHVTALFDAFLVERALLVLLRIYEGFAGAGVTQKINDHGELSYSSGESFALPCLDLRRSKARRLFALGDANQIILRAEGGCARRRFAIALAVHGL